MIWIFIITILIGASIVGLIAVKDCWIKNIYTREDIETFSLAVLIVSSISFFSCIGTISSKDIHANKFIYEYNSTKELIESCSDKNYGNYPALSEHIISINREIANNKAKKNSPWTGWWFSNKIGDLEPLKFVNKNNEIGEYNE